MPLNEYKMSYCPKGRASRAVGQVGQIFKRGEIRNADTKRLRVTV